MATSCGASPPSSSSSSSGFGGVILVLHRNSHRLDELRRCLSVLHGFRGTRAVVIVAVEIEERRCWVLPAASAAASTAGGMLAGDGSARAGVGAAEGGWAACLSTLLSTTTPEKEAAEVAAAFFAASLEEQQHAGAGPLSPQDAASTSLDLLQKAHGTSPAVLVHLHESATTTLRLGPDSLEEEEPGLLVHAVLGVHEDTPNFFLEALEEVACRQLSPTACMAVALGERPLHSSATLHVLAAHDGWLAPSLSLNAHAQRSSLDVAASSAPKMAPRSALYLFVHIPGAPPSRGSPATESLTKLSPEAIRTIHFAVTAGIVWSHGAYSEREVKLSLVWRSGVDWEMVTLDRSCLDALPANDRAPREENIVLAALLPLEKQREGAGESYSTVVLESMEAAVKNTVATAVYQLRVSLCDISHKTCGLNGQFPALKIRADDRGKAPHRPISNPPIFCFLGGLEPLDVQEVSGTEVRTLDWPVGSLFTDGPRDELNTACGIYAIHHLHTEGRLLPALMSHPEGLSKEKQAKPEAAAEKEELCQEVSTLEASRFAAQVRSSSDLGQEEAPKQDLLDDRQVQLRFKIAARHQAHAYLFMEAQSVGEASSEDQSDASADLVEAQPLQVCLLRRSLAEQGYLHHFELLKAQSRIGDIIKVAGCCGIARGTGRPTFFVKQILEVDLLSGSQRHGSDGQDKKEALVVNSLESGLLVVNKPAGTQTFWLDRRGNDGKEKEREQEKSSKAIGPPRGAGPPLIKLVQDWAEERGSEAFHCIVPLKPAPSGITIFASRGSPFAALAARSHHQLTTSSICKGPLTSQGTMHGLRGRSATLIIARYKSAAVRPTFVALVAGNLLSKEHPETAQGQFGTCICCREPLRQLGGKASSEDSKSEQTPAEAAQQQKQHGKQPATKLAPAEVEVEQDKTQQTRKEKSEHEDNAAVAAAVTIEPDQPAGATRKKPAKLPAVTEFEVLHVFGDHTVVGGATLLAARPTTKVAEQVRRHLLHLGHPICGDKQFGDFKTNRRYAGVLGLRRLFLHCLEVETPEVWQQQVAAPTVLRCPLPMELTGFLERLTSQQTSSKDTPLNMEVAAWLGIRNPLAAQ